METCLQQVTGKVEYLTDLAAEMEKLQERRGTWANLRPSHQALGSHVSAEAAATEAAPGRAGVLPGRPGDGNG